MTYATLDDLTTRYGAQMLTRITDRDGTTPDAIDAGVVAKALGDTDAMIDGYLAARYRLPTTVVPPAIADLALTIAIYKLHTFSPDPKIEADYKAAVKSLEKIADGVIRLPIAGRESPGTGASGARITDRDRPLTAKNMTGFI